MEDKSLKEFIINSLAEDLGDGDHSSLACIPENAAGKARLIVKQKGILAGIRVAGILLEMIDKDLRTDFFIKDGQEIKPGDIAFNVNG
jgi:nicotinate-nucleotide pyrophosphorylase (carboxylating)